jgi:hypothetical protein
MCGVKEGRVILPPPATCARTNPFQEVTMYQVILLKSDSDFARARWDTVDEVVDQDGVTYSLRAGPRQPLPTDHAWDEIAVYAPDEISEEEFQDWYAALQPQVEELRLKY